MNNTDMETRLFINGKYTKAANNKEFEVCNPATGEPLIQVAKAGREDLNNTVHAAHSVFEAGVWSGMLPFERGRILQKMEPVGLFLLHQTFGPNKLIYM